MIDPTTETLISKGDVTKILQRRDGRRRHVRSVYRWMVKGVRGRKLESVMDGGERVTSVEALGRFLNHSEQTQEPPARIANSRPPPVRRFGHGRAMAVLSAAGI